MNHAVHCSAGSYVAGPVDELDHARAAFVERSFPFAIGSVVTRDNRGGALAGYVFVLIEILLRCLVRCELLLSEAEAGRPTNYRASLQIGG